MLSAEGLNEWRLLMKLNHKPLVEIETGPNKRGLNAVSHELPDAKEGQNRFCIATPSKTPGYVQITWFQQNLMQTDQSMTKDRKVIQPFDKDIEVQVKAHDGEIVCFALNFAGTMLATASDKVSFWYIWLTKNYLFVGDNHSNFRYDQRRITLGNEAR